MKRILVALVSVVCLSDNCFAQKSIDSLNNELHVAKVEEFLNVLSEAKQLSMEVFFEFFGTNNEAELSCLLSRKEENGLSLNECIDISKQWFDAPEKHESFVLKKLKQEFQKCNYETDSSSNKLNAVYCENEKGCVFYKIICNKIVYVFAVNTNVKKRHYINDILKESESVIFCK